MTKRIPVPGSDPHCTDDGTETLTAVVATLQQLRDAVAKMQEQIAGVAKSHYTVEEIARMTGRSPYTIRRWITEKRILAERVSGTGPRGRLLVPRGEISRLIRSGKGSTISNVLAGSQD